MRIISLKYKISIIFSVLFLFLVFFHTSCSSQKSKLEPLKMEIKSLKATGEVLLTENKSDQWIDFMSGSSKTGINSLKTQKGGAVFVFVENDNNIGKIWLKEKTQINLFQDEAGTLFFEFIEGDARISMFSDSQKIFLMDENNDTQKDFTGKDTLLHRLAKDSQLEIVPTNSKPEWANWCLDIELKPEPVGLGTLTTQGRTEQKVNLKLRRVTVDAVQEGDVVLNSVEQIFYNNSDSRLEGTFRFYLPEGASVTGLAMEINGKLMEGELIEKEKAKKIYQKIVDSMRDPAILEWEQGQMFKLRVFPIEPKSEKRLVLRFITPIKRNFNDYEYEYATEAPDMQKTIDVFKLTFNGKKIVEKKDFKAGENIIVKIPKRKYPKQVGLEDFKEKGSYTCIKIKPDFSNVENVKKSSSKGQNFLIMFDTSRSALETYKLAVESVRILLNHLHPKDRFKIVASDIYSYESSKEFVSPSSSKIKNAIEFLNKISPDGASDFTLAFKTVGENIRNKKDSQVVYIGNGVPTWGDINHIKLRTLAVKVLNNTPFHGLVIGKGASTELINDIAGKTGGKVIKSRSLKQISRFSLLVSLPNTKRIRDVQITGPELVEIFPKKVTTLFEGDELTCLFFSPQEIGTDPIITLTGNVDGKPFSQNIYSEKGEKRKYVGHRWASRKLAHMTTEGSEKELIVELSLKHGVLSRHTAFLVLESEEEYRKYGIERKNKEKQEKEARISGKNLESISETQANMRPNNLQAGDPVIKVPAPYNARSVTVILPFGESKKAVYDEDIDKWITRFLVPYGTPDGVYVIFIRITHKDDSVELFTLSYEVDSKAPKVDLKFTQVHDRKEVWKFIVTQKRREVSLLKEGKIQASAIIESDMRRVEIRLPNNRILRLKSNYETGEFTALWKPRGYLEKKIEVRVVAFDRALNASEQDFSIDPVKGIKSK